MSLQRGKGGIFSKEKVLSPPSSAAPYQKRLIARAGSRPGGWLTLPTIAPWERHLVGEDRADRLPAEIRKVVFTSSFWPGGFGCHSTGLQPGTAVGSY